jgi:hypothetical protein
MLVAKSAGGCRCVCERPLGRRHEAGILVGFFRSRHKTIISGKNIREFGFFYSLVRLVRKIRKLRHNE